MPKAIRLLSAVVLALLATTAAYANQLDMFGFNARAASLANAYTALADGPEAAFYNPGALIESRDVRATFGYSFSVPMLSLDLQTASGGDKTDTSEVKAARSAKAGQWINTGASGGIYDRVFFGLAMQIPVDGATRPKIFSPDRPYFLDYDTGIFGMTIAPAMAVQLAPNFGLGAGARITLDGLGSFTTESISAAGDVRADTMAQSQITGQASPIIGFYARSHEFLRFALVYQGSSYAYYHKTVEEQIVPGQKNGYVTIQYDAKYNYIPRRLTLGIVGVPDEHVMLDAEMDWVGWSSYYPPFPKTNMDFSAMTKARLAYTAPIIYQPKNPNFTDTVEIHFGIEPRVNKYLAFRVGYAYLPSPVPTQTGTTSIIAMPAHAITIGAGASFAGPKSDLVNIDLAITGHFSGSETINKISSQMDETTPGTNPGYPRLVAGAQYIFSALNLTFHF